MSVSALGAAQTFAYSSAPSRPAASGGGGAVVAGRAQAAAPGGLSTADLKVVSELKARDQVVRAHEAAHLAAGAGIVTRGASYTYQTGPDGQRYAIGGEVGISTSPGRTPEETLAKAEQIRAAALAPADPSGQDLRVAAQAAQMATEARQQLAEQSAEARRVGDAYGAAAAQADPAAPTGSQVNVWA